MNEATGVVKLIDRKQNGAWQGVAWGMKRGFNVYRFSLGSDGCTAREYT